MRRNIALLSLCQALAMSAMSIVIAISALVGNDLAPDGSLATFPVTASILGSAATLIPASLLMGRFGRRAGFLLGAAVGAVGGLVAGLALAQGSFWLFSLGTFLVGGSVAFAQFYRFAAADIAPDARKGRAISLVMAGGLLAAFLGPELAKRTQDLFAASPFLGPALSIAALCAASIPLLALLRIPAPRAEAAEGPARPLRDIMIQPAFIVAILAGSIGFALMTLVMNATPLAMLAADFAFDASASVIQWHLVAMFAPSFATGFLIERFGVRRIIAAGMALIAACAVVANLGYGFHHFAGALVLLGVGWNFMFVGGTALLTRAYRPAEKAKVQATNDFLIYGANICASFASGALLNLFGWPIVNAAVVPFLAIVGGAMLWIGTRQPRPATG